MPAWWDSITDKYVQNVAHLYLVDNGLDAWKLFPVIPSRQLSGLIAKYVKEDWLRIGTVSDYIREGAVESAGDDYDVGKQKYMLTDYGFHKDITKRDRDEYDNPYDPVQDAMNFVMNRINRIILKWIVNNFFTTGIWGTNSNVTTKWDAKTNGVSDADPVEKVMNWHDSITKATGYVANKMIITQDVFKALKVNTKITDKMATTNDKVVTKDLLARLFEVQNLEVVKDVNESGSDYMSKQKSLLFYAPDRPSKFNPSAGYFMTYRTAQRHMVTTSRIPMKQNNDALRIEANVSTDFIVVGSDLAVYGYNVVS